MVRSVAEFADQATEEPGAFTNRFLQVTGDLAGQGQEFVGIQIQFLRETEDLLF